MYSFQHIMPPLRLFHGQDCLKRLGRELERVGSKRAVIVCGDTLARDAQTLEMIRDEAGARCAGVYAGVTAHSPLPNVQDAASELRRLQADAVIAVGGGSAIVTARAASILLAEAGDPRGLCTHRDAATGALSSPKLLASKLPQFVIPTTPTTATVKAGSAILDPVDCGRLALFDPKTRATAVFVHPHLLATSPHSLVISASLNTVAMAVEGLLSRSGDPISDGLLIHALRMIADHLPDASPSDPLTYRSELLHASLLTGHATDYTGAGIAIPLGHAISAKLHMDNGIANAIVLPHVVRFNAAASPDGMRKLARALELPRGCGTEAAVGALTQFFASLALPSRLRDVGVPIELLTELAATAMEDWFVGNNPRRVTHAGELEDLLRAAW